MVFELTCLSNFCFICIFQLLSCLPDILQHGVDLTSWLIPHHKEEGEVLKIDRFLEMGLDQIDNIHRLLRSRRNLHSTSQTPLSASRSRKKDKFWRQQLSTFVTRLNFSELEFPTEPSDQAGSHMVDFIIMSTIICTQSMLAGPITGKM